MLMKVLTTSLSTALTPNPSRNSPHPHIARVLRVTVIGFREDGRPNQHGIESRFPTEAHQDLAVRAEDETTLWLKVVPTPPVSA